MKSTKNFYEILSRKECQSIANIDGAGEPIVVRGKNAHTYGADNAETYYVAINVWLCLLKETSPRCAMQVGELITRKGLLYVIAEADEVADLLIHNSLTVRAGNVFDYLLQDVGLHSKGELEDRKQLLFLLRFLKRFSPTTMSSVKEASLEKFLKLNDAHGKRYRTDVWFSSPAQKRWVIDPTLPRPHIVKRAQEYAKRILSLLPTGFQVYLWEHDFVYVPVRRTRREGGTTFLSWREYENIDGFPNYAISELGRPVASYEFGEFNKATVSVRARMHLRGFLCQFGKFSDGSTSEGYQTLAAKISDLGGYLNALEGMNSFRIPGRTGSANLPYIADRLCRVTAVPKSYKAARIIAMEPSFNGYLAHAWLKFVEHAVNEGPESRYLVLNDQGHNQFLAWQGSWKHDFCTRDLSGASDSISRSLGFQILPDNATWIMYMLRADDLDVKGSIIRNNIFGTSGFTLTFAYESVIFLSLERAATDYCTDFAPAASVDIDAMDDDCDANASYHEMVAKCESEGFRTEEFLRPRTFGDDMESDTRLDQYIDEVLRDFGFVINETKSYGGDYPYRESCGEEFWNGYTLSSVKWPRTEFKTLFRPSISVDELMSLIQLEHKIFEHFEAREFLISWIKSKTPITESVPYSEYADLWRDYPHIKLAYGPYATIKDGKLVREDKMAFVHDREYHATLIQKFPSYNAKDNRCVENWRYREFLRKGPRPLDAWCAQLAIPATERVEPGMYLGSTSSLTNKPYCPEMDS